MSHIKALWVCLAIFFISFWSIAASASTRLDSAALSSLFENPNSIIADKVREKYEHFGLAFYYNNVAYYVVDAQGVSSLSHDTTTTLTANQWLAAVGRYNVLLIKAEGLSYSFSEENLTLDRPLSLNASKVDVIVTEKSELSNIAPELDKLRYNHLYSPLAWLTRHIEDLLVYIFATFTNNWLVTIFVFALLIKLVLLPISVLSSKVQRKTSLTTKALAPKLAKIKAEFDGEQAHIKLMAAHKDAGVTPFYTLKPLFISLIQIPILIAIFNALGEAVQISGHSFLWVSNIAYPDAYTNLSSALPMFGAHLNLLPFIMAFVTLASPFVFRNSSQEAGSVPIVKICLIAVSFFVLFYAFPAIMIIYWTVANILQTILDKIISS